MSTSVDANKILGVLAHLCLVLFPIFGPLLIWLLATGSAKSEAKEALNFQLTVYIVQTLLIAIGRLAMGWTAYSLASIVGLVALILAIIAAVSVAQGKSYRYPLTLRLIP